MRSARHHPAPARYLDILPGGSPFVFSFPASHPTPPSHRRVVLWVSCNAPPSSGLFFFFFPPSSLPSSWHLLNDTIDELLRINPRCIVVSSVERRAADGIDEFLREMRGMENVGGVEKVWSEKRRQIEIYVSRGRGVS